MTDDDKRLYDQLVASSNKVNVEKLQVPKPAPVKPLISEEELTRRRRAGVERRMAMLAAMDKARLPDTNVGRVPLRHGQYGMSVEEYLNWKRRQREEYKFERKYDGNDTE